MKYKMEDGTIIDTVLAADSWEEATRWNGSNRISVNTGSQWHSQTLRKSKKGRYYVQHTSCVQGECGSLDFVTSEEAARWLLLNDHVLPDDLAGFEEKITE
jgi:hypothetical protein